MNRIGSYNPTTNYWSSFGSGLSGEGYALASNGTTLFVGGAFTSAGGVGNTSYVAKWEGGAWLPLRPNTPNGIVRALAIYNNVHLIIGGSFTQIGTNSNFQKIARYPLNGNPYLSIDTSGLNGDVYALCSVGRK